MTEYWRPVVNWKGLYEVSSRGQVRSLRRKTASGIRGGHTLKQFPDRKGYLQVMLCRNGTSKTCKVHRLVAEAFIGPLPSGMETRHGPAGNQDNSVANLSYGTPKENHADMVRDGTRQQGSAIACAKLTEQVVQECRARRDAGESIELLAAECGVHRRVMHKAVQRETWRHVA